MRLEAEAKAAAGVDFNLASPKQLGELLFDTLGLERKKSRRTKTGWSTDAAVLEKLEDDHPVVALVLVLSTKTMVDLVALLVLDTMVTVVDLVVQEVDQHTEVIIG